MPIKIVIADDSDLLMLGVQALIQTESRYAVVSAVQTFHDLVKALEEHQPEVVILSECLYDTDIFTAIETIPKLSSTTEMMVVGMTLQGSLLHGLFMRGVKGYLYRSDPLQACLLVALRTILQGLPFLSPTANAEYLVTLQSGHYGPPLGAEARTVLNQLARGVSISQIALQLGTSPRRVYAIRDRLRQRFGVQTNEHLISRAVAEGFTTLSSL